MLYFFECLCWHCPCPSYIAKNKMALFVANCCLWALLFVRVLYSALRNYEGCRMSGLPITQPSVSVQPKITIRQGVLCVYANLQRSDYVSFQLACNELCQSPQKEIIIDLTRCTYGTSSFVGDIVEAVTQMKTDGKSVCVKVSPELGRLLHMAHLYHLFSYIIVDPQLNEK